MRRLSLATRLLSPICICGRPRRPPSSSSKTTPTRSSFTSVTSGTGYAFVSATTDAQIADRLAEIAPQIIVLDVMLSGFDGWEVLGRLRTHPRTADTPVVMCSILPLEKLALNLGAAAFLQKPVSREALLAVLTHLREARGQQPCSAS